MNQKKARLLRKVDEQMKTTSGISVDHRRQVIANFREVFTRGSHIERRNAADFLRRKLSDS